MSEPMLPPDFSETIDLLGRVRGGDRSAANELFARYGDRLAAVVRLRLGSRLRSKVETCDVVQDALVAALPHVDRADFGSSGAFFHWLTKLVENRIRDMADHFGAQKRDAARERPLQAANPNTDSLFGPIAELATTGTPSRVAMGKEEIARLEAAMDALPDEQREALLLVRYEGMSMAEAGTLMNRSPDAVRMLASRAIVKLGQVLGAT